MDVIVYRFLVVQYGRLEVAKLFTLPSVEYVRLCNVGVPRLYKYLFGAVLYGLHAYEVVLYLILKVRSDLQRDEVYIVGIAGLVQSAECLGYRPALSPYTSGFPLNPVEFILLYYISCRHCKDSHNILLCFIFHGMVINFYNCAAAFVV